MHALPAVRLTHTSLWVARWVQVTAGKYEKGISTETIYFTGNCSDFNKSISFKTLLKRYIVWQRIDGCTGLTTYCNTSGREMKNVWSVYMDLL